MTTNLSTGIERSIDFAHFQVIIAEEVIEQISITEQINNAVNGKYLPGWFQVKITYKS